MLFNDVVAIRHVCTDPDTVIVTLDADDMLLRHNALRKVLHAHMQVGILLWARASTRSGGLSVAVFARQMNVKLTFTLAVMPSQLL